MKYIDSCRIKRKSRKKIKKKLNRNQKVQRKRKNKNKGCIKKNLDLIIKKQRLKIRNKDKTKSRR